MKVTLQTVALLPLLVSSALAADKPVTVTCRTDLGTKYTKYVPTTTVAKTSTRQPTVTKTVKPTVTVSVKNWITNTEFTTDVETVTDTTVTDTFSTTTTVYEVETETFTSTVTTEATKTSRTSSVSTTVYPTNTGWKPIGQTINNQALNRREASHPHAVRAAPKKGAKESTYPAKVTCTRQLPNTKTKTVTKTLPAITKTVQIFKTLTETDTISSTSTVVPADVSTTITDTSTSMVTTSTTVIDTATTYVTTTTTAVLPGPTYWDACKSNNIWGPTFNNAGVQYYAVNVANNGPGVGSDFKTVADGASTATDCCNACQLFDTCETWIFRATNRNCFLLSHTGATCRSQDNHPNFVLSKKGPDTGSGYIVGNGNCGYTYSGNSDGTLFQAS